MSQVRIDLSHHFRGIESRSKSVKRIIQQSEVRGAARSSELAGDIFNALYQQHPQLLKSDDPNNKYYQTLRSILGSDSLKRLRSQTSGSLQWSSIGATLLLDEVTKAQDFRNEQYPKNDEECDNPEDKKPTEKDTEEEKDGGDESGDEEELYEEESDETEDETDSDSDNESDDNEDSESEDENGEESPGKSESGKENTDESDSEPNGSPVSNGKPQENFWADEEKVEEYEPTQQDEITDAVEKAAERLEDLMNGLAAGKSNKLPTFDDAMNQTELVAQLAANPMTQKILKLVGRLKLNARFLPAMVTANPEEIVGITTGRDISQTLPQDLGLLLGNDQEFALFVDKYNNSSLLQFQSKNRTNAGNGPMYVCVDDSASMYSSTSVRADWAKSLTIATYLNSLKEKRYFACNLFSDSSMEFEPKRQMVLDPEFMNKFIKTTIQGGTNFNRAWINASEFIKKQSRISKWKQADIVFITDGEGAIDTKVIDDLKKRLNIRLVTIVIGQTESGYLSRMSRYAEGQRITEVSDAIVYITDLTDATNKDAFVLVNKNKKKAKV